MMVCIRSRLLLAGLMIVVLIGQGKTQQPAKVKGQRVFTAGHSFHWFIPDILKDIADGAGITGHEKVGVSKIGASFVHQHWDVPEEKNLAKKGLREGKIDVLTLSAKMLPDDGIENFLKLGLEHNPKIRITVQENWLPFDVYDPTFKNRPAKVDHDAMTAEQLRKMHAPYFKSIDEHIAELNKKYDKQVLFVVPVGQAVIALREKVIMGKAPGLKKQEELFTDANGHATAPLQVLNAYCHFAVIYRRSPVGLPAPRILDPKKYDPELNRVLQELAWEAVRQHPLSGVTGK
jgi:hypothetical protein